MRTLFLAVLALMATAVDAKKFKVVKHPSQYTGSNTPYPVPSSVHPAQTECGSDCQLVQLQLLVRHGTRNPKKTEIEGMQKLEEFLHQQDPSSLTEEFQWLAQYRVPFDMQQQGQLVEQGYRDLAQLAQRDRVRYMPYLDRAGAMTNAFQVRASSTKRAQDSGQSYLNSLFGPGQMQPLMQKAPSKEQDIELRPFSQCPRIKRDKTSGPTVQLKKQAKDMYLDELTKHISKRISRTGVAFPPKLVKPAYQMCQYENAIFGRSRWCTLFCEKDFEKLEYREDLGAWYGKGNGTPINKHIACPLFTGMFNEMTAALNRQPQAKRFSLRFAHAETVMVFVTTLGLYDGVMSPSKHRPLNVSKVTPFAANVRIELWSKSGQPLVRAMVNERPVVLPGCQNAFCPFGAFAQAQRANINCDFRGMCA